MSSPHLRCAGGAAVDHDDDRDFRSECSRVRAPDPGRRGISTRGDRHHTRRQQRTGRRDRLAQQAAAITAQPFVERGLTGTAIGEAMRRAQIEAIAAVPRPD